MGIAIDIRAAVKRRLSAGFQRQTAKRLAHYPKREWWLTPLLWGIDTGLIFSTYRVSFCSWILLLAAVLTVAPPWAGIVYGLSFGLPLMGTMFVGDASNFGKSGDRLQVLRPQLMQLGGTGMMMVLPIGLVLGYQ